MIMAVPAGPRPPRNPNPGPVRAPGVQSRRDALNGERLEAMSADPRAPDAASGLPLPSAMPSPAAPARPGGPGLSLLLPVRSGHCRLRCRAGAPGYVRYRQVRVPG